MKREMLRSLEAMEKKTFGSPQVAKFLVRIRKNPEDVDRLYDEMRIGEHRISREARLFLMEVTQLLRRQRNHESE